MSERGDTLEFGDLIVRGWNMYLVVNPARGSDGETLIGAPQSEYMPGTLDTPPMWLTPRIMDEEPVT